MNHLSNALSQPLPEEADDPRSGGELPPYSGESTRCIKCANTVAFTKFRPASPRCLWDYNGRTAMRGPLPERLERECELCEFQWDEALRPADGVRALTRDEVVHALMQSAPYALGREAADYIAVRLLDVAHVLLRPEHSLWNQPPAPPVDEQIARETDPAQTVSGRTLVAPSFVPRLPDAPAGPSVYPDGSEQ
ncbi:hypothetical protein [Streptomyces sp. NPDC059916]|uniref:hypothetical protein n=1 Tax=Streptomyces sp. NPDC059916 TaxID=3347001 RepID=UPI00367C561C